MNFSTVKLPKGDALKCLEMSSQLAVAKYPQLKEVGMPWGCHGDATGPLFDVEIIWFFLGKNQEGRYLYIVDLWDRNDLELGYDIIFLRDVFANLCWYDSILSRLVSGNICRKPHVYPGVLRQKHGCSLQPIHWIILTGRMNLKKKTLNVTPLELHG